MVDGGVEAMLGLHWYLGPVRSGGLYAEANGDVAPALPPIGPREARTMGESLAAIPAFLGARGRDCRRCAT